MFPNGKDPILIVDDDADDRYIILEAFRENQCEKPCMPLENGDQLMEFLHAMPEKESPSLIVLDLNMPGKDGKQALKEIKQDPRFQHIPTVILTTSASLKEKHQVYSLGANCFITKPGRYKEFLEIIKSISHIWC